MGHGAHKFAGTAKGFHIHPPFIPEEAEPHPWFKRLFIDEPENYSLRPYSKEQWDVMFFIQGNVEMILIDERTGMPRRVMRYIIGLRATIFAGANNAAVVRSRPASPTPCARRASAGPDHGVRDEHEI